MLLRAPKLVHTHLSPFLAQSEKESLEKARLTALFLRGPEKVRNAQSAVMKPTWSVPNLCPSAVKILPVSTRGTIEDMARLVTSLAWKLLVNGVTDTVCMLLIGASECDPISALATVCPRAPT